MFMGLKLLFFAARFFNRLFVPIGGLGDRLDRAGQSLQSIFKADSVQS